MQTASLLHDDTKRALLTLWSWLRRAASRAATEQAVAAPAPTAAAPSDGGVVLRFPLRGEALLVRLAELLRQRVAELVPHSDRLTLSLSHNPLLCLTIDANAYVQFDGTSGEFNLVIEAPTGTRMIIQTTDFDAVVKFVLQYVVEKLSDDAALEVAS